MAGIIPILHSSGVIIPGQLGPIKIVLFLVIVFFTSSISNIGIPSVIQTIIFIPALLASRIELAANLGGTYITVASAFVSFIASFTSLKTGRPK